MLEEGVKEVVAIVKGYELDVEKGIQSLREWDKRMFGDLDKSIDKTECIQKYHLKKTKEAEQVVNKLHKSEDKYWNLGKNNESYIDYCITLQTAIQNLSLVYLFILFIYLNLFRQGSLFS